MFSGNSTRKFKYFRLGNQSPDPVLHTATPEKHFEMSVVLNVCAKRPKIHVKKAFSIIGTAIATESLRFVATNL